jgi:PAS domain S-box-containing protein
MIVIIAHAIVRHRLMDMRVMIRKSVVYFASFVAAGAILAGLILLTDSLFGTANLGLASDIVLSLAVAVMFHPLKASIQQMCDRYLYRGHYDYQHTVKRASAAIIHLLKLPLLLKYLASLIGQTMRSEWMAVYLASESAATEYRLIFHFPLDSGPLSATLPMISASRSALPAVFTTTGAALSAEAHDTNPATTELKAMGVELGIPLIDDHGLMGFILLGPKLSGDAYFSEDIDLLSTLANQAGVAIKNAQLYEQVVLINEYLQNILGTIESGVIAVNHEESVTIFNRAAETLTGREGDAVRGRSLGTLPSALAEPLRATAADGQQRVEPEVELTRADGTALPVIYVTSPLREPGGSLLGAVGVFSDLTPLKQLETERLRTERLAYFEALAAGIAHEIKNPLVAIKTFTQLLPRKFQDDHFREQFGRVVGREIGRMENLLDRLRSLAKPGGRPHRPLDVRDPITNALELLQPRLNEKGIATVWTPGPPPPRPVRGDHEALEQLFLNLFMNALEAMTPGGTLAVRVESRVGGTAVEIEDTGPGVPEALHANIFDPFVTTKLHGSGLGLAISASIANAHGARIQVRNKTGRPGAVFTIEFPAEAMAPAPLNA